MTIDVGQIAFAIGVSLLISVFIMLWVCRDDFKDAWRRRKGGR